MCIAESRRRCARGCVWGDLCLLFPWVGEPTLQTLPRFVLVKVRGGVKMLAAFFTAGVVSALDPTPSFTLQSWEVLAKEGIPFCEDPGVSS